MGVVMAGDVAIGTGITGMCGASTGITGEFAERGNQRARSDPGFLLSVMPGDVLRAKPQAWV